MEEKTTVRNKSYDRITSNGYIRLAIFKNRIIFMQSDATNGFKVSRKNKIQNGYVTITVKDDSEFKNFIGDYPLEYDALYEYWYIAK